MDEFKRSVGSTFRFELRALTRGFRGRPIESDPSNVASLMLVDVPVPVTGLAVEVTQGAIDLHWSPPAESLTGGPAPPISEYRVYRSERNPADTAKVTSYRMAGEAHETSYADANFEFGRLYDYKVTAVVTANRGSAESQDSAPVEIVPRDIFPPAVPAGLTGLYTSGAVELVWDPNLERDLAGYNIRRRENGQKSEQLNRQLLRSPLYRDAAVVSGHRYFYQVAAVDLSGNESGSSPQVEVEVP